MSNKIEKACTTCQTIKPLSEFYKEKKGLYGHHASCKKCHSIRSIAWQKSHPERAKQLRKESTLKWKRNHPDLHRERMKRNHFKWTYGITLEERDAAIEKQNYTCGCCGRNDIKRLVVDHNHKTGEVRGFICDSCNLLIGWKETNPDRFDAIMKYLDRSVPRA